MNKQLVSIIVSCYNAEKFIFETLKSLTNQTYKNIEIIVIDDGSIDKSATIIKNFSDNRIKYYYQSNAGQCAALNKGYNLSEGKLIKFYDADDILHPAVIEGQVESLNESDVNDISFIEWRRFYKNDISESINLLNHHTIHRDCSPIEFITFSGTPPMYQCGMWLIPRALLATAGLWNEALSVINDTEFFSRLLSKTSMLRFSNAGYTFYRTNPGTASLSSDFSSKGIRSAIKSTDLTARWYLSIEDSASMKQLIVQSYLLILNWSYPKHSLYSKIIVRRIKGLSNEKILIRKPGKAYNIIMKFLGWKVAKYFSYWYYRLIHKR